MYIDVHVTFTRSLFAFVKRQQGSKEKKKKQELV